MLEGFLGRNPESLSNDYRSQRDAHRSESACLTNHDVPLVAVVH